MIKRSSRTAVDLERLGKRSIVVDCNATQADRGIRIASITGAFVALHLAVDHLLMTGALAKDLVKEHLAAVSVGILPDGYYVLDLDYTEDPDVAVNMNAVMTESDKFVEIRGTGEEATFSGDELNATLFYRKTGIEELTAYQKEALYALASEEVPSQDSEERVIVITAGNPGKAKGPNSIFGEEGYTIKTLSDCPNLPDVEEAGRAFEENARLEAGTVAEILQKPVLADDSGLIADALEGMPGIYPARFASEPTNDTSDSAKLLYELMDMSKEKGQARFHYTLVFAKPEEESLVVGAEWPEKIGAIPRDGRSFGHDSLFYVPELSKTVAELSGEEKNKVNHRG